jgi:5'-phosphate synthase pdxT subunit
LIIPGGESTTLGKLIERNQLWDEIRTVPNIFGTCAGAIMLAKKVVGQEEGGQKFLELMDIEADRNAYGSQVDSFEEEIAATLGKPDLKINAIFIRAPKIKPLSEKCEVIATRTNGEPIAISERLGNHFYLATSFHPELSTSKLHEYFLKEIAKKV